MTDALERLRRIAAYFGAADRESFAVSAALSAPAAPEVPTTPAMAAQSLVQRTAPRALSAAAAQTMTALRQMSAASEPVTIPALPPEAAQAAEAALLQRSGSAADGAFTPEMFSRIFALDARRYDD